MFTDNTMYVALFGQLQFFGSIRQLSQMVQRKDVSALHSFEILLVQTIVLPAGHSSRQHANLQVLTVLLA